MKTFWIKTIPFESATGKLKTIYKRIVGPEGVLDNILQAHSLRPHSLQGHMTLYKSVLHHSANTIPKWFLEALGVYVSHLNRCEYCFDHHFAGMARLLEDSERASALKKAMLDDDFSVVFDEKERAAFAYARALSLQPPAPLQQHTEEMRGKGWDDGEILEINQVVAYFAYANRTVMGLGVNTKGDHLGLSPNDSSDPNNWSHN